MKSGLMKRASESAVVALLTGGCLGGPSGDRPDSGFTPKADLELRWRSGLPRLPDTAAPPVRYVRARTLWRTATTSFSRGIYPVAAEQFLRVAEELQAPLDDRHGRIFRAARCMAYENAARAFRGVRDPGAGVDALDRAGAVDPGCAHSIALARAELVAITSSRTSTAAL